MQIGGRARAERLRASTPMALFPFHAEMAFTNAPWPCTWKEEKNFTVPLSFSARYIIIPASRGDKCIMQNGRVTTQQALNGKPIDNSAPLKRGKFVYRVERARLPQSPCGDGKFFLPAVQAVDIIADETTSPKITTSDIFAPTNP